MIGCVLTVFPSSSSGPFSTRVHRSNPRALLASSNVERTAGSASNGDIIPTDCDPCPGNRNAKLMVGESAPFDQCCTPREPAADRFQHHVLPGADTTVAHRFIQSQGNRRG